MKKFINMCNENHYIAGLGILSRTDYTITIICEQNMNKM